MMLHGLRTACVLLGAAALIFFASEPAQAGCELIKATHSAGSKAEAAKSSQALVVQSAAELKRKKRWSYVTLYAKKVKGDPFWNAVRPGAPPPAAVLKPDIVTSRFYTTCFTGVVVPIVLTTGYALCGP
jgi:hypothetical protein